MADNEPGPESTGSEPVGYEVWHLVAAEFASEVDQWMFKEYIPFTETDQYMLDIRRERLGFWRDKALPYAPDKWRLVPVYTAPPDSVYRARWERLRDWCDESLGGDYMRKIMAEIEAEIPTEGEEQPHG